MRRAIVFCAVLIIASSAWVAAENRTDPDWKPPGRTGPPPAEAGTDTCPGAIIPGPLPYFDPGDTCAGTNTLTNYSGTCTLPFPYGGEDLIYNFTVNTGNSVGFSADLTGSTGDLALFVITTCGDGTTCLINSQDSIGPGVGPEIIDPMAYPVGTHYLYVDSYYDAGTPGSCGTYALDVTGLLPVELMEFTAE